MKRRVSRGDMLFLAYMRFAQVVFALLIVGCIIAQVYYWHRPVVGGGWDMLITFGVMELMLVGLIYGVQWLIKEEC